MALAPRLFLTLFLVCISFVVTPRTMAADLVISHVTLLDGTGGPALDDAWVHVSGERIAAIGTGTPPSVKTMIDGSGRYLIPGLIDSHIHLGGGRIRAESSGITEEIATRRAMAISDLHGYLFNGVTSVYDSGNFVDFIYPLRDAERAGEIISPRIFATGQVVAFPGGYGAGAGATIIGSPDDFDALDRHLGFKPDMVKFLLDPQGRRGIPPAPMFTPELLKQAIARVHDHGIRTTVHIPTEAEARMAIEVGIDALAHPPARAELSDAFATYAQERGIPISTTLTVFGNIARVAGNPDMFDTPLYRATLSEKERMRQKTSERERYMSSGMSSFFARMLPSMMKNLQAMHEGGATLAMGTDRSHGPAVHQELALLDEAGIAPTEALKIATLNAAIYLGKQDDLGSIEVDKLADMVLLSADPNGNIANAQSVVAVFKGGEQIDLTTLDLPINR